MSVKFGVMGQSISQLQESLQGKTSLSSEQLHNIIVHYQGRMWNDEKTLPVHKAARFVKDLALKDEHDLLGWIEGCNRDRVFVGDLLNRILAKNPLAELSVSAYNMVQDMKDQNEVVSLSQLFSGAALASSSGQKATRLKFAVDLMGGEGILRLPRDVLGLIFEELGSVHAIGRLSFVCKKFFNAAMTVLDRVRAPRLTCISFSKAFFKDSKVCAS